MPTSPFNTEDTAYDPFSTDYTESETSAEKAIDQDVFRKLLDATDELKPLRDLNAKFFLLVAGRLGLRVGEILHMRESWVDDNSQWVEIPEHQPCDRGKGGGMCGACRQAAKQMAETNDVPMAEVEDLYWKPKTIQAARVVPYSFHDECVEVVESYFDEFDKVMFSRGKAVRLCDELAELASVDKKVRPHGLRATAAMYHVETGLDMWALQSFMGWAYPSTARKYILNNSKRTKILLEEKHEMSNR
jgi:integrase